MKYLSLFSGIGGFEYGIQQAFKKSGSAECIGFSETDRWANAIYRRHFPKHQPRGNARHIISGRLPDFDLLVGGFPCQSFSIAGKRGGFKDSRGTLFFEIARIAGEKQPRILLLENVRGLLSNDKGQTFGTILSTLDELGYDCEWQVLDSQNFGVPQQRRRTYIIGYLRAAGGCTGKVFFIGRGESTNNAETRQQSANRSADISYAITVKPLRYNRTDNLVEITNGVSDSERVYEPSIARTLKAEGGGMGAKTGLYLIGKRIRRLTPLECERAQGFPDYWTATGIDENGNEIKISDTQRYRCIGNAVTTNVVETIINRMIEKGIF